ncbi:MAG: hypothetical protein VB021_09930 [Oscillospiraceae bacterium]|nr:hypothetical protein [Oscillospiraceae bacterium]
MKTIYIDSDFNCHTEARPNDTAAETDAFDGKCDAYIEGYRFVPAGQTWTRADGVQFQGEMIAPRQDYAALERAQNEYEKQQYEAAVDELLLRIGGETA